MSAKIFIKYAIYGDRLDDSAYETLSFCLVVNQSFEFGVSLALEPNSFFLRLWGH